MLVWFNSLSIKERFSSQNVNLIFKPNEVLWYAISVYFDKSFCDEVCFVGFIIFVTFYKIVLAYWYYNIWILQRFLKFYA